MKVLLINPHYYTVKKLTSYERFFTPIPILGLAYISSILMQDGHKVHIIDDFVDKLGIRGIISFINEFAPGIIGISCLTPYADDTYLLARKIKENFPEKLIVMGNTHADYYAQKIVNEKIADVVVHGEGEITFKKIVNSFEKNEGFSLIGNITYFDGFKSVRINEKTMIENLDMIPYPAWNLFKLDAYFPGAPVSIGNGKHLPILISRGCPYNCIYCSQEFGNTVRMRSIENVIGEMRLFYEKYYANNFVICDANFPLDKKYALNFCKKFIDEGLSSKISWATETRPDLLDDELVFNMKKAGCKKILMGFESGSNRILKILNKRFTIEDSKKTVKIIKKHGITVYGLFVIGNPTETKHEIMQTVNFAIELDIDFAKFNLFVPYPGTKAFEIAEINSRINAKNFKYFYSYPDTSDKVVYTPLGITNRELLNLQRYSFLKFYFRPKMFYRQLIKLRHMKIKEYWDGFIYILQSLIKLIF